MTELYTNPTPTGGQWNFAGVLFQLLATLRAGTCAVVSRISTEDDVLSVRVVVEPDRGGDTQILAPERRLVDQMKIRRGQKAWTFREVVEKVLPDLYKAQDSTGGTTVYRFVTNNLVGTEAIAAFLDQVRTAQTSSLGPDALDDETRPFRWGNAHISATQALEYIAESLAGGDTAAVWSFLGAIEIVGCSEVTAIAQINELIGEMVDDRNEISTKRQALCTALLELGRSGETIALAELFRSVGLEPAKLTLQRDLPRLLLKEVRREADLQKYEQAKDVRSVPLLPSEPFVLFSGDSGQGKTWRLCQAALGHSENGGCAILLPAVGSVGEIEDKIANLIWRDHFGGTASLARIAELLAPKLTDDTDVWLTVYLDDLADATLAHSLARRPWERLGVRLVVTAQNRITQLLVNAIPSLVEIPVPEFTLPELRDYLGRAGRDPHALPDDVLLSLLRPVLASIYCKIPGSESWSAVSEYELLDRYWRWATAVYRSQPLHRSDAGALIDLAGTLLDGPAIYPWSTSVAAKRHFDASVRDRLLTNGLLREDAEGALEMTHSRLLNWVIALEIARRFSEDELDLQGVADQISRLDHITTPKGDKIGRRLGYVLHDLFWMLAHQARPEVVGALSLLVIRDGAASSDPEYFFTAGLGSLGAPIVPALTWLARQRFPEEEWLLPRYIAATLIAVGEDNPAPAVAAVDQLFYEDTAHTQQVALRVMKRIPVPQALDRLWEIDQARGRAFDAAKADRDWGARRLDKEQSHAALANAVMVQPEWLARKAATVADGEDASQIVWLLVGLDPTVARPIWQEHKARLLGLIPMESHVAPRAIRLFVDRDELGRVWTALEMVTGYLAAMWFNTLARLDPDAAIEALGRLRPDDFRGTAHWWLPGLVHRTGARAQAAVLAWLGEERCKGDPVLMTLTDTYQNAPELLVVETFDHLLDNYEECLAADAAGTTDGTITRRHLRALIANVNTPVLLDRLAARANSSLEALLVDKASARAGRSSMVRDRDGDEYHQILAAIGGNGYDRLVLSELERPNIHARTDGVTAARWTRNAEIKTKLETIAADPDDDTYRQVRLMGALAAHHADEGLTRMIRGGAPLSIRAVEIREQGPPWPNDSIAGVSELLTDPDPQERLVGISLCAFLPGNLAGELLEPLLLNATTSEDEVAMAVGVLAHLGHYRRSFLARVSTRLDAKDGGTLAAKYLAWLGDEDARKVLSTWLGRNALEELNSDLIPIAFRMLAFEDSAAEGRKFLRRVLDRGFGFGAEGQILAVLAESGDSQASEALQKIPYQRPNRSDRSVIAAIRALARTVPLEALAAAERIFRRNQNIDAAALILEMDPEAGLNTILNSYRCAPAPTQDEIGRLLRNAAPREQFTKRIAVIGRSPASKDRLMAAELAGWLPAETHLPILEDLADDESYEVETAALSALARRRADAEVGELITRIEMQPRARQWAWLLAIIRLGDPSHLTDERDPRAIHSLLDRLGEDFREEANRMLTQRAKELKKEAERRERDRD